MNTDTQVIIAALDKCSLSLRCYSEAHRSHTVASPYDDVSFTLRQAGAINGGKHLWTIVDEVGEPYLDSPLLLADALEAFIDRLLWEPIGSCGPATIEADGSYTY